MDLQLLMKLSNKFFSQINQWRRALEDSKLDDKGDKFFERFSIQAQ